VSRYIRFINENNFDILSLGQNYRSTKVVVDASDSLIRKNQTRIEKKVFTENEKGNNVTLFTVNDDTVEATKVINIVRACEKAGWTRDDIAILYRTSSQSRILEEQFLKNNIPYTIISGLPFYSRKEVKDMIAYVRLILNQYDQEAFRRVANVPKRSIGPASVDAILKYVEENPDADIFDACENVKLRNRKAQMGINNFVAVIEELYITANEINQNLDGQATLADLIRRIVILTDYEKHLNDTVKNKDEVTQRMSNVYELMNIASNYTDIEEFVDNMMGYSDEDEEDEEGQATVKMLTMHASKGLEWPIVIIVGCNEGTSPHFLSIRDGNLEEERRLFYVAMTRAKKQLFLSRAKFVRDRSGIPHATHESRFISEIDSRYINKR
jgi:DNA helicase-2/ATP-dependent DNA helicase PcrA